MAQVPKRLLPIALVFATAPATASAQHFVCTTVRAGDTASGLAFRLTHNAANRHRPWFQIINPVTSRFVSKDAYDTILPGWRACLTTAVAPALPVPPVIGATSRSSSAVRPFVNRFMTTDLAGLPVSWILAFVFLMPFAAAPAAKTYLDRRRRVLDGMWSFAVAFVREFARPLPRRHPSDRPVAATVRCAPCRGRMDILLAPTQGHCYPNLSDHRKNLLYDIERVLRVVPDQTFACREPYQHGSWVVIPFRIMAQPLEEGVK